ncbi:YdeI/OmpD-associated family protein [Neotabrizicola shimadae]|uniref:YdeI/OmpD-associated family protein n=1 Tax=Neotabrizicola shimadae TaxID=2807096 RepID=A0A8G0ZY13_9RHOB|nr:YdeI/OmpD-associated family protein [Neotabrizicola shimadae]QYZ71092.1 YdeI/OmpD-associated family protein [Neotabrizicola shimadae]
MITEIEDYFTRGCGRCARFDSPSCSASKWHDGLVMLRQICLSMGLVEVVKWGHPCYMHAGRNIAVMGALQGDFRLSFFHAALLSDPDDALERQGPNTRHPDMLCFTDPAQVGEREPILRRLLAEAMAHAEAGRIAPRDETEPDLPGELADALDSDPALAEAFFALTRGRRRSYVIALSSAKQSETRRRRIEAFRDRIFAGKGATER